MNMKSKIISATLVGIGFLVGATALSALADWTAAPGTPPTCPTSTPGCNAPLNVGPDAAPSVSQTKLGSLVINSNLIDSIGLTIGNAIKIVDGNQGAGKVLTSDANGVGTWQLPTAGGGTSGWITIPSGFTNSSGFVTYTGDMQPTVMCVQAGYTTATGACKGTTPGYSYEGTLLSHKGGGGVGPNDTAFACQWGINEFIADANTQILCLH